MIYGAVRQYVAAGAALMSVMSSATCFGWVGPILVELLGPQRAVPMTRDEVSWVVSVIEIGNMISPIPAGMLMDRWGRKSCILATGPLFVVTWIIVLTTNSVEALYLVRILQGMAMGIAITVVPVYLAEIASPDIRGRVTSSFQLAWCSGLLIEYCVGPFVSYQNFAAITAIIPVLQTVLFCWQPESPYYLLMCGRSESAKKSLSVLRMLPEKHQLVLDELEEIKLTLISQEKKSWNDFLSSSCDRKNLFVVFFISFVTLLSGGFAAMSFTSHIFTSTKTTFLDPDNITIFLGSVLFLSSFFSSVFVDRLGRRPLLIISTIGCFLSLFSATCYFYFSELNTDSSDYSVWLFVSMMCYFMFLSVGLVPVYVTYQSELFSSNSRGTASSIIVLVVTIYAFVNLKSYFEITEHYGFGVLFGFYTTVCFVGIIGVYLIAPETKGKSLLEIQNKNILSQTLSIITI